MMLVLGIILALLSLLLLTVQKTYYHLPRYELKRRARSQDRQAQALYKAVAYDSSLHVLLWGLIGLSTASAFVLLARALPLAAAFGVVAILTWWSFVWLPGGRTSKWSLILTQHVTPLFAWLTSHLHPLIQRVQGLLPQPSASQNDIYEVEDLLAMLELQKDQPEARIDISELEAAQRVLTFGHKAVRDIVLPRRNLKLISADDPVGPILLTELHDSGLDNFVVYKDKPNNVVGTLSLHDALAAHGGMVANVTKTKLTYVNESQSLAHVLQAFRSTKSHIFMVVNHANEFVGIVTIEQALNEALGELQADNFESFESREAVASYQPVLETVEENSEPEIPEQTDEPTSEPPEETPPITLD